MIKVREERAQHIFNEFCIFHHQPPFNETEGERERRSGKLMKMSSFDICQLWEDFCLVSSAFCYANTTVSTHNGGGNVSHVSHAPHIEFDKLQWEETTEHVEAETARLARPL